MTSQKYGPNTEAIQIILDRIPALTQEQKDEMNRRWEKIDATMAYRYWWDAWGEVRDHDTEQWSEPFERFEEELPAAGDAIAATALKGMISEDAYDSLMGIWERVVGSV
ncbi:hypothetical protein [Ferrimicrobium acidiphilum]|uniref:hypothetical protein n=1 Tax=Ferrimicrobium acidiphilum TaxID=121039 RepID=UPI0023F236B3|nr:hypothetical protein [Ferrimicrobium acidiphilum]